MRKRPSHLPNRDCPSDQETTANAETILSLAQTVIAFAEMKLSLRHWSFGNRDRTLHTLKTPSPHLRWKHCRQNKGQEANAKAVYAPCIRLYFMPDTPTNRPAKTITNVITDQNWAGKPCLQNVLATTLVHHTHSMFHF